MENTPLRSSAGSVPTSSTKVSTITLWSITKVIRSTKYSSSRKVSQGTICPSIGLFSPWSNQVIFSVKSITEWSSMATLPQTKIQFRLTITLVKRSVVVTKAWETLSTPECLQSRPSNNLRSSLCQLTILETSWPSSLKSITKYSSSKSGSSGSWKRQKPRQWRSVAT